MIVKGSKMNKIEFLEELQDVLQREDECLENDVLADYEEWDSLSKMAVMAFYNKKFGIKISLNELMELKTVQDLILLTQGNVQ